MLCFVDLHKLVGYQILKVAETRALLLCSGEEFWGLRELGKQNR
jgi:hypothetical protein